MKKNIGKTDKVIRILIGVFVIIIGAYFNSVWGVLGMIPLIISETGICPLYALFRINTIPEQKKREKL